jgi:hypothetical protein
LTARQESAAGFDSNGKMIPIKVKTLPTLSANNAIRFTAIFCMILKPNAERLPLPKINIIRRAIIITATKLMVFTDQVLDNKGFV